ncbi:MAG: hypothetical protein WA484_15640 [Solirubrobacteraceae bacterium]
MRLDDPLLPIWVYEHHGSIFARIPRKDLAKTWKVGADERSTVWVSSRTFRDAVLYRSVEPLRGKDTARCSSFFAYRRHDSVISL